MRYISTRGQAPALNFEDVLLAGLASDGGLYVPENLPRFTVEEIASWAGLPYHELAFRVMRPFVAGSIADADFKKILEETYGVFEHNAVAPLRQLNGNEWVLELFHGPTLAFKDFALQLLGRHRRLQGLRQRRHLHHAPAQPRVRSAAPADDHHPRRQHP